jgi:hypothetical protein
MFVLMMMMVCYLSLSTRDGRMSKISVEIGVNYRNDSGVSEKTLCSDIVSRRIADLGRPLVL